MGIWLWKTNSRRRIRYNGSTRSARNSGMIWLTTRTDVEHTRSPTRAFPRTFSINGRIMCQNGYLSLRRIWCGKEVGTTLPYSYELRYSNDVLSHNPKANCNDDYRYWMHNTAAVMSQFIRVPTTEHTRTRSGKTEERATEMKRSILLWKLPSDLLTCLSPSVLVTSKTRPPIFNSVLYTGRIHTNLLIFFFFRCPFDYTLTQRIYKNAVKMIWSNSIKAVKNARLDLIGFTSSWQKRK